MTRLEEWVFENNAIVLNGLDEEKGTEIRDSLLNKYIELMNTNTCLFPHNEACQMHHDDVNHSRMGDYFSKIMAITHELEGVHGVVDIVEKIRREKFESMLKQIEDFEKTTKEEK